MSPLADVRVQGDKHRAIVTLTGEIDLANADAIFSTVRFETGTRVVIDLSAVRFIDSSGIAEIVRLNSARPVSVVAPTGGQPRRVLEIVHVVDVIPTYETLALASADWFRDSPS
jgi:anti-anti-sigma factor